MNEKNVFQLKTLSEQIYHTMGPSVKNGGNKKYNLTFPEVSKVFRISSPELARNLYKKGERRFSSISISPGRRPELSQTQEKEVIDHLINMQNQRTPLSPSELLCWINEEYKKDLSQSWPFKFIERNENRLFLVDADPLEEDRTNVTYEQLIEYEKKFKKS